MIQLVAVVCLFVTFASAQDAPIPAAPAGGPAIATPVAASAAVAETVKLASKDWRNYKGCDDTCLTLCLEKPADYESKCSVLFSNNTLVNTPSIDTCKKAEVIRDCTYQCSCACKRCSFCKQELVNSCSEDKNPLECFDHVIDNIVTNNKCD
jgi:hypothetical protein